MKRYIILTTLVFIYLGTMYGQQSTKGRIEALPTSRVEETGKRISKIVKGKDATVEVYLIVDGKDNNEPDEDTGLNYWAQKYYIMSSVLKYLNENNIPLERKILLKKHVLSDDEQSQADVGKSKETIDIVDFTVSKNGNNRYDILLHFIGGESEAEIYIENPGMSELVLDETEQEMQDPDKVQYTNWSKPNKSKSYLENFRTGKILPENFHFFSWKSMAKTTKGADKIKRRAIDGVVVEEWTGNEPDMEENGIEQLPDGRIYCLSIIIRASDEGDRINRKIINDITKAVIDSLCVSADCN